MTDTIDIARHDKTIRFFDIFDTRPDNYCDTLIDIREIKYSHNECVYYDISYTYNYSHDSLQAYKANPFNYSINNIDNDGVIIIKNDMTSVMVKYLLMPPEELEEFIGDACPIQYKINIMVSLAKFWD